MDYEEQEERPYYPSMFKDANQLREELKRKVGPIRREQEDDKEMNEEGLEEMFDGQEIDD